MRRLISYIAPGAPATRRPVDDEMPFLRPEIGFTPAWFRQHLDVDFGRPYHEDVHYRIEAQRRMRELLRAKFPDLPIGIGPCAENVVDGLTGAFGACTIAAIYGLEILYAADNWPTCAKRPLTAEEIDRLQPQELSNNAHFQRLFRQAEICRKKAGVYTGFVNLQGVLNNAQRLRGQDIFIDMILAPTRVHRLMECVTRTMIHAGRRLEEIRAGALRFFTVSNCLVNMISPDQYRKFVLPYDRQIAETFGCIGVHNCAWSATPYLNAYAEIPDVAYIDMGRHSDLTRARELFPVARRALMYTPMDLRDKPNKEINADLHYIAKHYGPCDVVIADIEAGTPDQRVRDVFAWCDRIARMYG